MVTAGAVYSPEKHEQALAIADDGGFRSAMQARDVFGAARPSMSRFLKTIIVAVMDRTEVVVEVVVAVAAVVVIVSVVPRTRVDRSVVVVNVVEVLDVVVVVEVVPVVKPVLVDETELVA